MIQRMRGVQIAARETEPLVRALDVLLGAKIQHTEVERALGAQKTVLGLGRSEIEILEPDGDGPVADILAHRETAVFGASLAVPNLDTVTTHLSTNGVQFDLDGGRCFVAPDASGCSGLYLVVSEEKDVRDPSGLADCVYEITYLVDDAAAVAHRFAGLFGLDEDVFHPIESKQYGYTGFLTLFNAGELDRLEIITPNKPETTMGRFFAKHGASLYMFYAESARPDEIVKRVEDQAPGNWNTTDSAWLKKRAPGGPTNMFLHPKATGGVLIGISATEFAWTWSGDPARAQRGRT